MRRVHLLFLGLLLSLLIEVSLNQECPRGYEKANNGTCVDEDECSWDVTDCGPPSVCINTVGSYTCQCKRGHQSIGGKCKDINECSEVTNICGLYSQCNNTDGSYFCTCTRGFIPSHREETFKASQAVTCDDLDECTEDDNICGNHANCTNTIGGYYCTCDPGYSLQSGQSHFNDSQSCEHVCTVDATLCGEGSCNITEDGHECLCKTGFTNYGFKTMRCSKLNCESLMESSTVQIFAELDQILQNLRSSCGNLSEGALNRSRFKVDGAKFLEMLQGAIDNLLSGGPLSDNRKVTALLEMTENILKMLGPLLPNATKSTAHTEIQMLVRRDETPPRGPLVVSTSDAQLKSFWETAVGESYLGFASVSLLSYKSLKSSVSYFNWIEKQKDEKLEVISKVVSAVVTNNNTTKLKTPIELTFSHLKQSAGNQTCVFWDSSLNGGAWSTKGCTVVKSNISHTVCSCNHLSSFAVLMALHDIRDIFELKLITWVGLSLSLVCLLISILTFRFIRSIQGTRNTIHLHLCVSLFIANIIFLAGITQTENKVGCSVIAGLLHFFFLAAFCWMCLEGVQLFRMVVLVFHTTLKNLYLMAAGYGVPGLIVAISAIINAKGYGSERHCWLNLEHGFIWSFFGPVCVIIVVNIFFFLITVWKLAEKFSSLNQDLSNLHKIKTFTVTAIAQLCVLGTMWIFGCFQFEKGSLAMTYLFTILNSLQGALVFVMHCLFSKQVREEYAKILTGMCAPQKRQYSEFSTNQSSKSQASKSVQHTGESQI